MSQPATKADIDEVIDILKDFMGHVDTQFGHVDTQFGHVDTQFGHVDTQLSEIREEIVDIKEEIVELKESHNRLLNTVDGFVARIDQYETEQLARDRQFEKLLEWARKVSEKTGIPLENL